MTAKEIQKIIQRECVLKGHKIVCPNLSNFFISECDVLSVTGSGYAYEYEVKISRSDFFADKKKVTKHRIYANPVSDWDKSISPNYLIYVVPDGLVKEEEVPEYAGLTYVENGELTVIKPPKKLHDMKPDQQKLRDKVIQLYQQRDALGCTMLTHLNRQSKIEYEKYEAERKEQTRKLLEYAKTLKPNND